MSDPRKYTARSFTDRLAELVPGFGGYLARENRRDADAQLRQSAAERLGKCKDALDDYMQRQAEAGNIDELPQLERVRTQLDRLQSSVRGEVRGYSAFFDRVEVNEDLLDRIYERDLGLLEGAQLLLEKFQKLRTSSEPPSQVTADLRSQIESLETHFSRRRDLLEGTSS